MMMAFLICSIQGAVHFVWSAAFDFDLYGSVIDLEVVGKLVHHRCQNLLPASDALLGHDDVATACDDTGADCPDMQVVRVQNAWDSSYCLLDRLHVHPLGRRFKQHIDAL